MINDCWKKALVVGIVVLFFGMAFIPSSGATSVKKTTIPLSKDKTLYVGGSGPNNYSTIRHAIIEASDGDTVFVYDDSSPYYEEVYVDKVINLIGENKDTTIIDSGGEGDVIRIEVDGVQVSGFTLQNSGKYWKMAGIDIMADNATVTNNNIKNCCDGINIYENRFNNVITENTISSTHLNGIGLWYSSENNLIFNNTIHSNEGEGIKLFHCGNNSIFENVLQSNHQGIFLSRSHNNMISENIFDSNERIGLIIGGHSNTVCNNDFINDGMFVSVSINEKNSVYENTVNEKPLVYLEHESDKVINTQAGQIILVYCDKITIQDQVLTYTSHGIQLEGSDNCIIIDNIITDNNWGIHMHGYDHNISDNIIENNGYGIYGITQRTIIEGNIIQSNDNGIHLYACWRNKIIRNRISDNSNGVRIEYGSNNTVSFNNFIDNKRDVGFNVFSGDRHNNWNYNYWQRPRIFPKIIFGKIRLGNTRLNIPWINFDRYPARKPFDI